MSDFPSFSLPSNAPPVTLDDALQAEDEFHLIGARDEEPAACPREP